MGCPPLPLSINVRSLSGELRNHRRDGLGELPNGGDERAEHRGHALRIGLAQRPGRRSVDIGIAGEDRRHPGLQPSRESERSKRFGQLGAGVVDPCEQRRVLRRLARGRKNAVQILEDHRQRALGEVAEAVGQLGIDPVDDRLGAVAAVLPEGDFAQQEIAQRVDPEALRQLQRVDDIADALRHLLAAAEQEAMAEDLSSAAATPADIRKAGQ